MSRRRAVRVPSERWALLTEPERQRYRDDAQAMAIRLCRETGRVGIVDLVLTRGRLVERRLAEYLCFV